MRNPASFAVGTSALHNYDASAPRGSLSTGVWTHIAATFHAGESYWHGDESLNHHSIGIEIVNGARCIDIDPDLDTEAPENQRCVFPEYGPEQLDLVIKLARDILDRYPGMDPVDVVGHADIAPDRRVDPGPKFPWRQLYEYGIGAW